MQVWGEAIRLIQAAWLEAFVYLAGTIAVWTLIDLEVLGESMTIPGTVVDVVLAYFLTIGLLAKGGLLANGLKGTFGTYFLVSLVSGIAVLVGLVLLVIPGVILLVRWLPAYGIALGEDASATGALGKSWETTRGVFWTLFLAMVFPILIIAMPFFLGVLEGFSQVTYGDLGQDYEQASTLYLFLTTVLSSFGAMAITAIGIASYSLLRDRSEALNTVFE